MEGIECHTKELELYLEGSKDLSRTIPRKAVINTRQEVKTLQCISALYPPFLPLIVFKWLWKDRKDLKPQNIPQEERWRMKDNFRTLRILITPTDLGNSTRRFQISAHSFTLTLN